jgi:hypothetical protein
MSDQEEPQPLEERVDDLIKETKSLATSATGEFKPLLRIMRETLVAIKSIMMFTQSAIDELQAGAGTSFDAETGEWMQGWVDQVVVVLETTMGGMPEGAATKEVRDLYENLIKEGKEISAFIEENTTSSEEDDEDDSDEETN